MAGLLVLLFDPSPGDSPIPTSPNSEHPVKTCKFEFSNLELNIMLWFQIGKEEIDFRTAKWLLN